MKHTIIALLATTRTIRELKTIHDIRVFVGFYNYYRRFIDGFPQIIVPLNAYVNGGKGTVKKQKILSQEAAKGFQQCKDAFDTAPRVLNHLDNREPIGCETNVLGAAINSIGS